MEGQVYYKSNAIMRDNGDAVLASILLTAMKNGSGIKIPKFISHKLFSKIDQIQNKYIEMYPELKKASVEVTSRSAATFFTGGVDSFYTILKNRPQLSNVIYVRGFDVLLQYKDHLDFITSRLKAAAKEMEIGYIEVESNFRDVMNDAPSWSVQFGAALVAVALSIDGLNKVYIPSSGDFPTHGSHPDLDPLWSTEYTEIVHDSPFVSRLVKVGEISKSAVAMRHLRVCWVTTNAYNCGKCEKCTRTLTELYIVGALSKAESFGNPSEEELVERMAKLPRPDGYGLHFAIENFEACQEGKVKEAIKSMINKQT